MDPQTTWDQLLTAYAEGDWDQIEDHAIALLDWLDRDGFPPTILPRADLGPEWDRTLAQAGCSFALEVVRSRWRSIPSHEEEP